MEFKVIVYIIIGIAWVFSKMLSAKGKQGKEEPVFPESWPKPFEGQLEPVKPVVRERVKIKHVEKPGNLAIKGLENINVPEGGYAKKDNLKSDEIVVSKVQILDEINERDANIFAQELSYEIRNGQFDWKRAVVINELLKQQHFRW
jgi:hypothetical protein